MLIKHLLYLKLLCTFQTQSLESIFLICLSEGAGREDVAGGGRGAEVSSQVAHWDISGR